MRIAVVVPARNEEYLIASTLQSVRQSAVVANQDLDIVVVLDSCTDATRELSLSYGCQVVETAVKSRALARNLGAACCSVDVLIFLDADTIVEPNFIVETLRAFLETNAGVLYYRQRALENSILARPYFSLLNALAGWRPLFSPAISVRWPVFVSLGGFDSVMQSFEDLIFLDRAWRAGVTGLAGSGVRTSIRRVIKFGYPRATFQFLLACVSPRRYAWRPINE